VFRSPTDAVRSLPAIESLLRDLGPQLRRGGTSVDPGALLPTGIGTFDDLLRGGFPRGALSEIAGPFSSGRTSLALALLARTTSTEGIAAVIDGADAFDPISAASAGVDLDRVLWARAPRLRETLRCAERVLEAHGFALVLLDLAGADPRIAPATWPRLSRAAAATGTALVVLSAQRMTGTAAALALETAPAQARFTGTPAVLEELEIRVSLVRHRTAPEARGVCVRLPASRAA
jgi:RecA/RadA recombinase